MIIERPVYFIEIEGNVKQYASQLPTTIIASYEEYINKTYVVVAADEEDYSEDVKNQYQRIHTGNGGIKDSEISVKYLKEGVNFENK